jgi:hypothetical protein
MPATVELDDAEKAALIAELKRTIAADPFPLSRARSPPSWGRSAAKSRRPDRERHIAEFIALHSAGAEPQADGVEPGGGKRVCRGDGISDGKDQPVGRDSATSYGQLQGAAGASYRTSI